VSALSAVTETPLRSRPRAGQREISLVLAFAFIGTLFDGAELNLIGYPLTYVADSLHVGTLQLIQVATYQGFASIAGGLVFGWLGDTLGRRRTYAFSVLMFGIAAVLGGLASTYPLFLLTRLLAGVGMGGLFGLSFAMFTEFWTTRRRGTMGGLIQSMYFGGQILTEGVLFVTLSVFGHDLGWRVGYVCIGVSSVFVALAAIVWLPESPRWLAYREQVGSGTVPADLRNSKVPLADILTRRYAIGTGLFMVLASAMFLTTNSLIAYLSTFLIKVEKVPLGRTSLIVLLGYIVTIITYVAAGTLSDRYRRKYAFALSCAFGLIGFTWFLVLVRTHSAHVSPQFWHSATFWALMMCAGAVGGFGVLGVWMSEFFPTRLRATGVNASYYVGRGIGAGIFPLFALVIGGSVPMALALGIIGPAAGLAFSLFTPDRTGREIHALE
jgi:SHS family lactate transporter-like MFS transporter